MNTNVTDAENATPWPARGVVRKLIASEKRVQHLEEALQSALSRMEGENRRSEYGFDDEIKEARAALAKPPA